MRHQIAFTVSVPGRSSDPARLVAESVLREAGVMGYALADARFSDTYADNLRVRIVSRFDEERPDPETAELKRFTAGLLSDVVRAQVPGARFVSLDSSAWTPGPRGHLREAVRIAETLEAAIKVRKMTGG